MALVQRKLRATFKLAGATFQESGTDTVTVADLRMSAKIVKAGGPTMNNLQLRIYGMTLSLMNQLSTLGMKVTIDRRNMVTLEAGDSASAPSVVFVGTIVDAWADMQSMPDVGFNISA